jgi:hypothetical protein
MIQSELGHAKNDHEPAKRPIFTRFFSRLFIYLVFSEVEEFECKGAFHVENQNQSFENLDIADHELQYLKSALRLRIFDGAANASNDEMFPCENHGTLK